MWAALVSALQAASLYSTVSFGAVTTGFTVSRTVMCCVFSADSRPQPSVAFHTRSNSYAPSQSTLKFLSTWLIVGLAVQLSVAEAGARTDAVVSALQAASLYSIVSFGAVTTGLAVSCTVKLCVSVMLLPQLSLTV